MLLENDKEVDVGAETFGNEPIYHHRHVDGGIVDDHEELEFGAGDIRRSGVIRVDMVEGYRVYPEVLERRARPHEFHKAAKLGKMTHAELYDSGGRQT